jgi:glycerate kinase
MLAAVNMRNENTCIAPDSYKKFECSGCGDSDCGFREIFPTADMKLPVADGGEGTVEAMVAATRASFR